MSAWSVWLDSLPPNSTTQKLQDFLAIQGHTKGMTDNIYEYLKVKVPGKQSHSERYQAWKEGGFG